jgi:type IV secretion system protein VirB3
MALRTVPVRASGNRPNLFMGGDRELVMVCGLASGALVFSAMEWQAIIYGLALWFSSLFGWRLMAKKDPLMRKVYMRSLRCYKQKYYPPRSTPFRVNTTTQGKQYK